MTQEAIQTPLIDELLADPQKRADLVAGAPLGRLGLPEDLASDESRYASGATFVVDGGVTIR